MNAESILSSFKLLLVVFICFLDIERGSGASRALIQGQGGKESRTFMQKIIAN
jgi:hypothetical protein